MLLPLFMLCSNNRWRQTTPACRMGINRTGDQLRFTLVSKVGEKDTSLGIRIPKAAMPLAWLYRVYERIAIDGDLNTHRLTESDFGYDVTLSRWRPWRYFAKKRQKVKVL